MNSSKNKLNSNIIKFVLFQLEWPKYFISGCNPER